jgi:hypothetical protein
VSFVLERAPRWHSVHNQLSRKKLKEKKEATSYTAKLQVMVKLRKP